MNRSNEARELLDGPLTDVAELAANLRDMARVNRLSGGVALSRRAIDAVLRVGVSSGGGADGRAGGDGSGRPIRLLDVGTGSADIPLALLDDRRRGRPLEVVAVDSRPEVVQAAEHLRPGIATQPGLTLRVADGRALPFEDGAFDVAHTSLVLHHLDPDDALAMLRELGRVARVGVVVNDLARGRARWLGAWLLLHLMTGNRLTRHDGPLSVRRAYTRDEAAELVEAAGLRIVHSEHGFLRHRWAIGAVPDGSG